MWLPGLALPSTQTPAVCVEAAMVPLGKSALDETLFNAEDSVRLRFILHDIDGPENPTQFN